MQQVATAERGYGEPEHYSSTGENHNKVLIWTFLGSECLLFGTLITTFIVNWDRPLEGPTPKEMLNIPYTSVSAFVLLMSSLAMVLALAALQRGDQRGCRVWIMATALMGMTFLGGQYFEFTTFYHHGLTLDVNLFGSSFFMLTGCHGAHVFIGVTWLVSLFVMSLVGELPPEKSLNLEIAGLFWHFVDVAWIAIFTIVYLIPTS